MNQHLIKIFEQLINQTENDYTLNRNQGLFFKLRNFKKALVQIKSYNKEIQCGEEIAHLQGIGKGVITRINEILSKGNLDEIKTNKNNSQVKINEINEKKNLQKITGIGPVKAEKLFNDNITLKIILQKYKENPENEFFDNFTHHQMIGIKYFEDIENRIPRNEIESIETYIKKLNKKIDSKLQVTVCGSYRRKKSDCGDIDVIITHPSIIEENDLKKCEFLNEIIKHMKKSKFLVDDLTYKGNTKYMGLCKIQKYARRIDIRLIPLDCYGSALLYFTGSGDFNKNMRKYALKKNMTLNEYGLFHYKNKLKYDKIQTSSEKDIFDKLGLDYVEPEDRVNDYKF